MKTAEFKIKGMCCAEEVAVLRKELGLLPGVEDLSFDILNAKMTIRYVPEKLGPEELIGAVRQTGMTALPWHEQDRAAAVSSGRWKQPRELLTIASGIAVGLGFLVHVMSVGLRAVMTEGGAVPLAAKTLYLVAVICGVWFVLPKAWLALRRLRPDMNLLMTIAVVGAAAIGEWFEAATVAFLFALSLVLESWSVARARRAVAALMALTPPKARIVCPKDHCEELVDVATVAVGTTVIVKPGEKFPLDGTIARGNTTVDQSPITGESMPVPKAAGDAVYAGTINRYGAAEFVTTKPAGDTTLAHIIRMVGEAQSRRAPSEQWVDTFARYYTPIVMALAVIVAVIPPLVLDGSWSQWFYQALVLLVIACPCALVISTPVSIVSALTSAARHGVLIKGGLYVEVPSRIRAIALDKTGTLTEGKPAVVRVLPWSGHTERELLEIAAAIEARSEHPLAHAIITHAASQGIKPKPADDFQALKGKGATAVLNGQAVWIGSHRYLEERAQEDPHMHRTLEELAQGGTSAVVVGNDHHVCGVIAVADRVRPQSRAAVTALREAGIRHIVMLTGDNQGTAQAIARQTGVDEVRAELLPEDKVKAVEELVARHGSVAMVGDGVNDAPAMARASLGIAMGAVGTDAAIETADIALMSDDLSRLPWLVRHSRRTLAIVRQNIALSLGVKALFMALALAGHASLWAAIAADMGVSLLVVGNALRLLVNKSSQGVGSHA
ncbi:MAG: heavy metal translocating P-type ATPase [Phycisphaerales bacterium]